MKKKILLVKPWNPALTSYVNQDHIQCVTRKSGGWMHASVPTIAALAYGLSSSPHQTCTRRETFISPSGA